MIERLKAAVDSIPSYIERSSQMWVLVPPVQHCDLDQVVLLDRCTQLGSNAHRAARC